MVSLPTHEQQQQQQPREECSYNNREGFIFVAGGVGVTGVSEAIQICASKHIPFSLIWIVRSEEEARGLGDDILWNRRFATTFERVPVPESGSGSSGGGGEGVGVLSLQQYNTNVGYSS